MALNLSSPIGLVAGSGGFPLEFARNARARGLSVVAVAHTGETDPEIESIVDRCMWIKVGQIGKLLRILKGASIRDAAFVGGVSRPRLLGGFHPDLKGLAILMRARSIKDDVILRAVASELESIGVKVFSPALLLEQSIVRAGLLAGREPSQSELADAVLGWRAAKELGRLDIGQTVVAYRGMVIAVEGIEGTDVTIRRGGELAGPGSCVVKVSKPQQDLRLDLPAVGTSTIQTMKESGARLLVLEHERAMMLDPESVRREAVNAGISILVARSIEDLVGEHLDLASQP